jgi:hypothetical protein
VAFYPGVLVLIGNGLSIATNPDLELGRLTNRFLEGHRGEEGLNRLLKELGVDEQSASRDFELVIGAIEAAEAVIDALIDLAADSPLEVLRKVATTLEEAEVAETVRHLYYSYCSEVLAAITELSRTSVPDSVLKFGQWIADMHKRHHQTAIFTLNYDVLVERMLVDDDLLGLKRNITDYFSGIEERMHQIDLVPGVKVVGRLFYPIDPAPRSMRLHHLHGCLTHFRDKASGEVLKVDSADVRMSGVFEFLKRNPGGYAPSIILGTRKVEKANEWPFSFAFTSLAEGLGSAHTVAIAGYGFRDLDINNRLTAAAAKRPDRRWIVIDHRVDEAADEFRARIKTILPGTKIEWYLDGFNGPLPDVPPVGKPN